MKYIRNIMLFVYLASVFVSVYILRIMPMQKRDDYYPFTDSVIVVSIILIIYLFFTNKSKTNNNDQ